MFDRLPDLFDPLEFVEKKRRIEGRLHLSRLDRLQDVLLSSEGEVQVKLEFKREGRIPAVEGVVVADLTLQCQCCLEPLPWPVRNGVHLGVVGSIDEIGLLPEELEPLWVEPGGVIAVTDIIQDELLLAIPSIPQHPVCRLPQTETVVSGKEHPFARLAELKNNHR